MLITRAHLIYAASLHGLSQSAGAEDRLQNVMGAHRLACKSNDRLQREQTESSDTSG